VNEKHLAVITPLILLVIMVAFTQTQIVPIWLNIHKSSLETSLRDASGLQLVGYNFNRDLVQVSVTLWNKGSNPVDITAIYYDNVRLTRGVVGAPTDPTIIGYSEQTNSSITSNDIIFPDSYHWNMYTYGGSVPVIQPNGFVTLYLGVSSNVPGTNHTLIVLTANQEYVFDLVR
jgi:hypothetical protein